MAEDFNLADLAGIDTTDVKEVRLGEKFPAGMFSWEITEASMEDDHIEEGGVNIQRLKALFKITCIDVHELAEELPQKDKEALAGKSFTHAIIRKMMPDDKEKSLTEFVGMIKAFLVDIGANGQGKLRDLMESAANHRFKAPIVHSRNKNDKDNPYVNLRVNKAVALAKAA